MIKLLVAVAAFTALLEAPAYAEPAATRVVMYTVADPASGTLRPGYTLVAHERGACWTGSISAQRPDAWRCMTGNEIHDPCFAPTAETRVVYCPQSGGSKRLIAIALTKPLPHGARNAAPTGASGPPTTIVLRGGVTCGYITGATGVVAGMRINYGCSDGRELLGDPDRRSPVWHIFAQPPKGAGNPRLVDIDTAIF
jgi:hypothetical protein